MQTQSLSPLFPSFLASDLCELLYFYKLWKIDLGIAYSVYSKNNHRRKVVLDYMNSIHALKKNNSLAMKFNEMIHVCFATLESVGNKAEPSGLQVCV